jgi:hypothetical protein
MKNKLLSLAGVVACVAVLGHFYAKPLLAQVRAALVQNVDEPGRNPYQEVVFTICGGTQNCNFSFSIVPPGKRLVVTHVNGFIDVRNGTLPNANVESSFGGSQFASIFIPGVRQTASANSTRIVYNEAVLAYFGPGESPAGFYGLFSTTDTWPTNGGGLMTLTGYYINL